MSHHHQWLYLADGSDSFEVFNGARTAAYLQNPDLELGGGVRITDVLDFGGCEAYAFDPPCDPDPAYIEFPGTAGNGASVPDAAALDILGDISIIVDVAVPDWTPSTNRVLAAKWGVAGQRSWEFVLLTNGSLAFTWTTNGTTTATLTSTANLSAVAADERQALRVDFDVNNGASGRTARFWSAPTFEGPWTLLGSAVTSATVTTIFGGSSPVTIGEDFESTTTRLAGKVFYAQVRNGMSTTATLGGTAVLTIDPAVISSTSASSFLALTGQTVTLSRSGLPPLTVELGTAFWEPLQLVDPSFDPAPWFTEEIEESADLLGFFIEEWTGLDNRHTSRQVNRTGRPGGGGLLGAARSNERVMKLNVLVIGRSERSLEYAFHWLAGRLGNICATCETSSMLLRRYCPSATGDDLWEGVAELREVGLVEDLSWESVPVEQSGCVLRRLSFTLAAGDPCMYSSSATQAAATVEADVVDCFGDLPLAPGKANCRPMCVDMPADCRTVFTFDVPESVGGIAPILTMENADAAPVPPLRIICYGDPHDDGVDPNPCGLTVLGEIYTQVIPPWTTIVWDVPARKVLYSSNETVGLEGGFRLMDAVDPPFNRFFVLPCGTAHIVIEPASTCLFPDVANSRYTYGGYQFLWSELHFPTMSLELQERMGCA